MNVFDIVGNINRKDSQLETSVVEKEYVPFVVNRVFSNTPDTVFFANEMNQASGLSNEKQYLFYRYGVPKNPKRFGKWNKADKLTKDVELIMQYFNYSRSKAQQVVNILEPHMGEIEQALFKGGRK